MSNAASRTHYPRSVLFVDDEPMATKWFERMFGTDYVIRCANSAEEALQFMALNGDDVGVIMTDFRMPGRDGLSLLQEVNQTYPRVIKILVSAYADKGLVIEAINQQLVFRVLEKPWDEYLVKGALQAAWAAYDQAFTTRTHVENSVAGMRDSLAFIADELTAPLSVIGSCLNMIQSALADTQTQGSIPPSLKAVMPALQASRRNISYCQNLMLGFTHATRTAFASMDSTPGRASDLAHLLCKELPLTAEQRAWIHVDARDDFSINTKQNLLYLCLSEFVQNAVRALQLHPKEPNIQIQIFDTQSTSGDRTHNIRIVDNGPSLSLEMTERLALRSRLLSNSSDDDLLGVDLMFCEKIMQTLGGSIGIHSTKTSTSVTLLFPFKKEA